MLTPENIQEFTKKYQTNERNVVREYIQHLFLSELYKMDGAEKLLFKGGTALRLIFQSPRFSEDLDFTGQNIFHHKEIDSFFLGVLSQLEKIGMKVSYEEAKKTTGGYLGLIQYEAFNLKDEIRFEVSLRHMRKVSNEVSNIISDFTPPYTLVHLSAKTLVSEKIEALLARNKPRDYYDLYFMLRHPELNQFVDKKKLDAILKILESEKINFKRELSVLLPISYHRILKDFKHILKREIKKTWVS